jgi:ribosomal protein L11 methyltransferase
VDEPDSERPRIGALLPAGSQVEPLLMRAARAAGLDAAPAFQLARVPDEDWVRRSQAQFHPVEIGERLWVGPSWRAPPASGRAVVRLDPGLAFGTGTHPSTRLVLGFLDRCIRGGERLLDYGCGSGILAIAAAKLGASRIDAVDLDPSAIATTLANAHANGVELEAGLPHEIAPAPYDVVLANILAQPLIVLAPALAARTAPRGRIALSGILETQADEVIAAYAEFFDAQIAGTQDGWAMVEGVRFEGLRR